MYKLNKEVRRKIENSMKASFMLVILILLFGCSKQETNSINKIYSLEDVVSTGYRVKGEFKTAKFPETTIVKWGFYKGREVAVAVYPTIELANTFGKIAGEEQTEKIEVVEKNIAHGPKVEKLICRGHSRGGGWTGRHGIKFDVRWNSEEGLGNTLIINKSRLFQNDIDLPHGRTCVRREPLYTEFRIHGNLVLMVEPLATEDSEKTIEFLNELIQSIS